VRYAWDVVLPHGFLVVSDNVGVSCFIVRVICCCADTTPDTTHFWLAGLDWIVFYPPVCALELRHSWKVAVVRTTTTLLFVLRIIEPFLVFHILRISIISIVVVFVIEGITTMDDVHAILIVIFGDGFRAW